MSDQWTQDYDVSGDISPKDPTQLNADDLLAGEVTVRITGFRRHDRKVQPWEIRLAGYDVPWRPCLTMRRAIVRAWGKRSRAYLGRWVRLYRDPETLYAGIKVGGIRISHFSDIPGTITIALQKNDKGKREWTFHPLRPQDIEEAQQDTQQPDPAWAAFVAALEADGYPVDLVDRWHCNEAPNPCPLREIAPANLGSLLAYLQSTEGAATLDEFDTRTTEQNQ